MRNSAHHCGRCFEGIPPAESRKVQAAEHMLIADMVHADEPELKGRIKVFAEEAARFGLTTERAAAAEKCAACIVNKQCEWLEEESI